AGGQMVGSSATTNDAAVHAFLLSGGLMSDLGTLGGASSSASFVNNSGQVAGVSDTTNSGTHAFLFSAGMMSEIGTLGGTFSTPYGMNDSGQVVGEAALPYDATTHAFLY